MNLIIDTTQEQIGNTRLKGMMDERKLPYELMDTMDMNISHCIGCNYCWLKTPGICVIKDDYEEILKKMITADRVWLLADTSLGFVSWQAKNIVDRVMPLVTMYLKIKDGQTRHVMRYEHPADFGLIYCGEADEAYLDHWSKRVALNFGSKSLGVYHENRMEEVVSCML